VLARGAGWARRVYDAILGVDYGELQRGVMRVGHEEMRNVYLLASRATQTTAFLLFALFNKGCDPYYLYVDYSFFGRYTFVVLAMTEKPLFHI
jgi:hypothetical protein